MEQKNNIKLTKQQQEIINNLYSTDQEKVLSSIRTLREKGGGFSIDPLMNVYFNTSFSEVRRAIDGLISDLKDNKISSVISENILKYAGNQYMNNFLSDIWQSSIKFDDILVFVELFIKGDDKTALESLTIIEQNMPHITSKCRNESLKELKSNINILEGFKHNLAVDLLDMLK